MNHLTIKINLLPAFFFFSLFSFTGVQAQTHTPKYGVSMSSNSGGYYEYLPQGYSATGTTLYPVLIMIHGMGEYGDGSKSQLWEMTKHGPNNVIKNGLMPTSFYVGGKTHKMIMITPQWKVRASTTNVNAVVDYVLSRYKADPSRIYITGLSAGGGVVEDVISSSVGKRFAAAVEFCGTSSPSMTKAQTIVSNKVALWGIHNKYDDVVSSSKTINFVDYVLDVSSTAIAKKTIPSSSSHNCWSNRYKPSWTENNLNIYQWMLQYTRTTNQAPVANAGSDKTIKLPTTSVTLSGSATDADGTIASYKWTKVSGPNTPVFSSTTSRTPIVSSLIAGTYTLRLTVTDDKGATDYDDMKVVVSLATTSGSQAVTQAVTEESATAATGLAITPNPFADRFVLTVNNTYTGTMKVQLVDVSGVVRKEFQVAKNVAGTVQTYLSAGILPAGNYFVRVQMEKWSQTKQVVKL